jgi:RNA polymerase sigma-70 factor, ECF subfamily
MPGDQPRPLDHTPSVSPTLLADFVRGDDQAFEHVVRLFSGVMYAAAYAVLGRRELAAEAVQQAFVAAWKASDTFDSQRELTPWLCTITRRCAIDVWRTERRHLDEQRDDYSLEGVTLTGASFEEVWEAWQVRDAVDRLPPDEREVMRLHHAGGYSHSQIAQVIGVPIGTVKSRTSRAHGRLRESLAHLWVGADEPSPRTGSGAQ